MAKSTSEKNMKTNDILTLAVLFRNNDPNIMHCSVLDAMESLGLAFWYGMLCRTPKRHNRKRRELRERIAVFLEAEAKKSKN